MRKVYYLDIFGKSLHDFSGFSQNRIEYIEKITDIKRKNQSYFVWKLLLKALEDNGKRILDFIEENGVWKDANGKTNFSLTHSNNIVAVLLSDENFGVDVETISPKILAVKKKYLLKSDDTEELTKFWVKRECDIKSQKNQQFSYIKILDKQNNEYILGANANLVEFIKIEEI